MDAPKPASSPMIREIAGEGVLEFASGCESPCRFVARQHVDGDVILECWHSNDHPLQLLDESTIAVVALRGQTDSQQSVLTVGSVLTHHVSVSTDAGLRSMHRCSALRVGNELLWRNATIRYELTNLFFWPDEHRVDPMTHRSKGVMILRLEGREFVLSRVRDHEQIREHLREHHGTAITAILETSVATPDDVTVVQPIVDRICALLSLSRSTLVVWTGFELLSASGDVLTDHFRSVKTKNYSTGQLIDDGRRETSAFIHTAYDQYVKREQSFQMLKVVHARLDVNEEGAFLETRGMVGSVLLEYLVSRYAKEQDFSLANPDSNPSLQNKVTFANDRLQMGLSPNDVQAVCHIRNHLLHAMRFATKAKYEEFAVVMHVLNVLILRLLDYRGPYIDCRTWERKTL